MKKILCLLVAAILAACSSDSESGTNPTGAPVADNSACIALAETYLPNLTYYPGAFSTDLNWVDQGNNKCVAKLRYSTLNLSMDSYYSSLVASNFGELIKDEIPASVRVGANSEKYMYKKFTENGGFKIVFQMWLSPGNNGYDFNAVLTKEGGTTIGGSTGGSSTTVTSVKDIVKYYFTGILSSNYINNKIVYNKMEASASDASIDGMDVVSIDFESLQSKLLMKGWNFNHSNDGKGCEYKTLGGTNSSYANAPSGTYTCGTINNARFTYSGYSCEAKVTYVTDSRAFRHGIILNYVTCSTK